jgi:glycine cleavage system regulatory protein
MLSSTQPESAEMNVPIVLTVVTDDHPGIVEELSDALATHGGNWTESSMMTLAGKFAGILLAEVPESSEYSIELIGQDHPGIVHDVTEVLARLGINVLELETSVRSASMSGESLFIAHARILIPPGVALGRLRAEMEQLANELMVDIDLNE